MSIDLSAIEHIQDKMVTVMGLGRFKQGSGVGAAKWLLRHGAQIVITDLKTEEDLRESVDEIMEWYTKYRAEYPDRDIYQPVFVLGEHHEDDFTNVDMVVQNPGVARESEFLELARKENVAVESDISLFFRFCPFPIISITGTRGKSTTTALLGEMLKTKHPRAVIAGNIQRSPLEDLDWLLQETEPVPIVLELSSWLLESIEGRGRGPDIAILTNAFEDHLNRYDSFEHYLWAKELIFKEQNPEQIAILNSDQEIMDDIAERAVAKKYWFSKEALPEGRTGVYAQGDQLMRVTDGTPVAFASLANVRLEGQHNVMNILAASLAAHFAGVTDEGIAHALTEFSGLPGRQELIDEVEGVFYINDTTATNPDGMRAALKHFGKGGNIILLAGGNSKKLSYDAVGPLMVRHAKYILFFEGDETPTLEALVSDEVPHERVESMEQAVARAAELAELGDIVLLSPGASSFATFKNEFDRGDQFRELVQQLAARVRKGEIDSDENT